MRTRFNYPLRNFDQSSCIIIVEAGKSNVGLIVDRVREVIKCVGLEIKQFDGSKKHINVGYVIGSDKRGGRETILLNVTKLLMNS